MNLRKAIQTNDFLTENGMSTNSSSLNFCLDLFFTAGAMRGSDQKMLIRNFSLAYQEDPTTAMKILFWIRDIRGGAGEREIFKTLIAYLASKNSKHLEENLHLIPFFGRWDDLLALEKTPLQEVAFSLISKALMEKDSLCAKWMPRKGSTSSSLRNFMGLSPKSYRKMLVQLTDVVESKMCSREWNTINFEKIPSLAAARYQKAFSRNCTEKYNKYIALLKRGEAKINSGAIYPYDVLKSLKKGNGEVSDEQWRSLPNYLENQEGILLPLVDVSGSMSRRITKNSQLTALDVAVSLGIYISEKNDGIFKDSIITFSESPKFEILKGNLSDRYEQLIQAEWGRNTDLYRVFVLILQKAKESKVPPHGMPSKILILSDMEFDSAMGKELSRKDSEIGTEWENPSAQEMIEKMYVAAGYAVPSIIYWNILSGSNNLPVAFDKSGAALISGFSPSILKSVLGSEIPNPLEIMENTIFSERYSIIKIS